MMVKEKGTSKCNYHLLLMRQFQVSLKGNQIRALAQRCFNLMALII